MSQSLSRNARITSGVAQVIAAVIFAQALIFKFAGAPESVEMFSRLGVEPWGRWLTATAELVAVALLLRPRTAFWGGALGVGLMVGALGAHVTKLGIVVANDGGMLFGMAVTTLIASITIVVIRREALRPILFGAPSAAAIHPAGPDVAPTRA